MFWSFVIQSIGMIAEARQATMDDFMIVLEGDAAARDVHPVDRVPLDIWFQAQQLEFRVTSHYFSINAPITWQKRVLYMPQQSFAGRIEILLQDGDTFDAVQADQRGWTLAQHIPMKEDAK